MYLKNNIMEAKLSEIDQHIMDKINYHDELRMKFEIDQDYMQCAKHRDEIARLNKMLSFNKEYPKAIAGAKEI